MFDLTDELRYWLPLALGGAAVLLVLRPRLRLLRRGSNERWTILYYLVPAFMLCFGSMFVADYLTQATGRLTRLSSPAEVPFHPVTRFYQLPQAYAYKPGVGVETTFTPTGRNNDHLRIDVYVACPLLPAPADTAQPLAYLWLGWHQSESLAANLPSPEKEARYQAFLHRCDSLFQAADLAHYTYLVRPTAAEGADALQTAAPSAAVGFIGARRRPWWC